MPTIRQLLARTTPNAPYAPEPTPAELVAVLRLFADHAATAAQADAILHRWDSYRAWFARQDALRSCIVGHDLKATPQGQRALRSCSCATCGKWRRELRDLYADKQAQEAAR